MNIKVSIIIPVYNVAPYIEKCLLSVLNQTYKNIEIIIVDDCCQDNSMEKAREVITRDPNANKIKYLAHEKNRGLSAARNMGTFAATGEYIYYLDSDDYLYPGVLNKMIESSDSNKVDVLCCNAKINGKTSYYDSTYQINQVVCGLDFCKNFYKAHGIYYPPPVWIYLYNRNFLINNGLTFREGYIHEDEEFTPRIMYHAKKVALLNVPIQFHLGLRDGSITSKLTLKNLIDSTSNCRELYRFFSSQENSVNVVFYHSIYMFYLITLQKAKSNKLTKKSSKYFTKQDSHIMGDCSKNDFERRCAKLAGISLTLMFKYYENTLPLIFRRLINRFL